jgi:hypothetical protein
MKTYLYFLLILFLGRSLMAFDLSSPAFVHNEMIPDKYTCEGMDISPPLQWSNIPEGTKSLALIMDDPDAPVDLWVHWVLYNIPIEITFLPENLPKKETISLNNYTLTQGLNTWPKIGYGGPCPPDKEHRYFFKLFALKEKTNFPARLTAKQLEDKIKPLIIQKVELIGKYDLKKRRK